MSKLSDELIEKEYERIEEEMQLKRAKELSEYEIAETHQLCQEYGIPCEYGICDECVIKIKEL